MRPAPQRSLDPPHGVRKTVDNTTQQMLSSHAVAHGSLPSPVHPAPDPPGGLCIASEAQGAEAISGNRASILPAQFLDDNEIIIILLRPSVLYIPLSCLTNLAIIALLTLLAAYLEKWPWARWSETQVFTLGVAAAGVCLFWQAVEWYNRVYVLTDRRVLCRSGALRITVFQIPLRCVRHTSVFRRVRERLFGLGTICFATEGDEIFDASWMMVRQPRAVHRVVVEAMERYGRGGGSVRR